MDELEQIINRTRCPDDIKPLILQEARTILAAKKESTTPESAAKEAYEIILEGAEPTVVISIPDKELHSYVSDRLRGEVRIINCDRPETLDAYIAQRPSGRFNLIAVLGEADPENDLDPHRHRKLEEIIHGKNARPIIGWVRIGKKSSISNPTEGTERLPRAYSTIRALITEIENSLKGISDTPDMGTRVSPNWLQAQLSTRPEDHSTRLRLAADRLSERRFQDALVEYDTVLRAQPKNLAAIIGRSTALLSQWPDNRALDQFEAHGTRGLPALIADLNDHAKYESDPGLDYLVGKAIVLAHIDHKYNQPNASGQESLPLIDDAIAHLEKAFRQKRVNIDAGVSLALAYSLRGGKDDMEVAYELFLETLLFSDPLTEPIGRFVEYDRQGGNGMMGTQLLQLTGLHRAFSIGSGQFVLKRYERKTKTQRQSWERPGEGKRALIEQQNISYYRENKNRLKISTHGREQPLETPDWSYLVESNKGDYIFEIMPYLAGRNVGAIFESLNEAVKIDPAKRKQVAPLQIKHLEWITDACAALQAAGTTLPDGTPRQNLEEVRNARYPVVIDANKTVDVSWYTVRVFQKLVELYETAIPEQPPVEETLGILRKKRITLKESKREQLVRIVESLATKLSRAPDWLYVAYTDNNIRNYSVELPQGAHHEEEAYVMDSRKKRYDLENAVVLLGTSDQLTAVEHELCGALQDNDRAYLMNRWLGRIILARVPPPKQGTKARTAYDNLRTAMHGLDLNEEGKRNRLSNALKKYLKKNDPHFQHSQYQELVKYDSLMRHLTIYCDKVREAFKIYGKVRELGEQHGLLAWKPQLSWKQKARELREQGQQNTPQGQYAHLRGVLEDLDRYHNYHRERLEARLNDTREHKLYQFLKQNYNILT